MAKLTIDGKEIEVPDGTRLFDACTEARGEELPHFCYHPDLSVAASNGEGKGLFLLYC